MKTIRTILLICFSQFVCLTLKSQQQNGHWIFGSNVQVQFSQGNLVSTYKKFYSIEACASVSDPVSGDLLFFTDGTKVYDRNGDVMINGDNLKSGSTSAQGALILPYPNKDSVYLLITAPTAFASDKGLYYSVIDMHLNSGLGDVLNGSKNILLHDNITESLTYAYGKDSSSYWLLVHERVNNAFVSIKIDGEGLGKIKKTSNIGNPCGGTVDDYAGFSHYYKISPDNKKVAVSNVIDYFSAKGKIYLYDFDNCTGEVSNEMVINVFPKLCYGNEFSVNSEMLYVSSLEYPSGLYQIDVSSGNEAAIKSSLKLIYTAPRAPSSQNRIYYFGGLQRQADNKIYLVESTQKQLHCITDPDKSGLACNFIYEYFQLADGTYANYTLPPLVPQSLSKPKFNTDSLSILLSDTCFDNQPKLSFKGPENPEKIQWKLIRFNQKDTVYVSDSIEWELKESQAGKYQIQLMLTKNCQSYLGIKTFELYKCDCSGQISINDTCIEETLELRLVSNDKYKQIKWLVFDQRDNEILSGTRLRLPFNRDTAGVIKVSALVDFECGEKSLETTFLLTECPKCIRYFLPSSFTPNMDGINDEFGIYSECGFAEFEFKIFNRWGEMIFETNDPNVKWNGSFKNEACQEGVYVYTLAYRFYKQPAFYRHGTFHLLR